MKKLFLLTTLCVMVFSNVFARKKTLVDDQYQRNSLSVIIINRGDLYDNTINNAVSKIDRGDKFDVNVIGTEILKYNAERPATPSPEELGEELNDEQVGRQIVSYWFNRQADGTMDTQRILERGHYNATDQDLMNASASKVGVESLGDTGWQLIGNSYVLVLDYNNFKKEKNSFGKESWNVTTTATVYQLQYNKKSQDLIFDQWIDESDSEEVKAQKREAQDKILFEMKPRARVTELTIREIEDGGIETAIIESYAEVISSIEKEISEWNVTTSIYARKPLSAKIGRKEGLKNGNRYQAYKVKEDADGNAFSVAKGYIRATKINDNRGYTEGNTGLSEFYQISGGHIEEGMTIRQKNDLGMGVSLGYKISDFSPYNLTIDYLAHINTKGFAHYGMLNIGFDMFSGSKIRQKLGNDISSIMDGDGGISYVNFSLGYGFGFRPIRHIELVPFVMVGGDYMINNNEAINSNSNENTSDSFTDKVAWFVNPGLRANFNVRYPLQLFVQIDYSVIVSQGIYYNIFNDIMREGGIGHKNSFGIMAGIKWTF